MSTTYLSVSFVFAVVSAIATFPLLYSLFRDSRPTTDFPGLSFLGKPRKQKIAGTAVICGGSFSGILAARVCSDHFAQVIVVDPESSKVAEGKGRARVVQAGSLHVFLYPFIAGLRKLWPNIDKSLVNAGALIASADLHIHYGGVNIPVPYKTFSSVGFPQTFNIRRSVIETILLNLLKDDCSNLKFIDASVRGILPSNDAFKKVGGVVVRSGSGEMTTLEDVSLVIDCTGGNHAGLKWLEDAGYDVPAVNLKESYNAKVHYVTMDYQLPAEILESLPIPGGFYSAGWIYVCAPISGEESCAFSIVRVDQDILQVCTANSGADNLPRESRELEEFSRAIKTRRPIPGWVFETFAKLGEHKPISISIVGKMAPFTYIHYENMIHTTPSNFIPLGDASVRLNPIHGQGCSKAMLGSIELNNLLWKCIDEIPDNFSKSFIKNTSPALKNLWHGVKISDYGLSTTIPAEGEKLSRGKFMRWYGDRLVFATEHSESARSALWHARNILVPNTELIKPRVLWAVLKQVIWY